MKGHAAEAQTTWLGTTVYLNQNPPVIAITSPTHPTVTVPYLQLQGYAEASLQSVTFDLSNAVVLLTHQPGCLTRQYLDTNTLAYTTNYFQCYDIPLTNGLNTITVHATDLAGNVTVTNLNYTLDYSTATNPVIQLTWPQDGLQLCGSRFTLRGWVDDATVGLAAQITDTNGETNVVNGTVERTGVLWAENLPLAAGTNVVTLWVTNAAGLSSETNFSVVKSDMTLALTNIAGDLWLPTVNVTGTISDPTYAVYVNGVQGTNNGDGTWSAVNVPVSAGGVASFDMQALSSTGGDPDASTNIEKQTELKLDSGIWNYDRTQNAGTLHTIIKQSWTAQTGGSRHGELYPGTGWAYSDSTIAPDGTLTLTHSYDSLGNDSYTTNSGMASFDLALGALSGSSYLPLNGSHLLWSTFSDSVTVKLTLHIGGKGSVGGQALVAVNNGVGTETLANTPFNQDIPTTALTVDGLGQNLDVMGAAYGTAASGSSVSVNLTAPVAYHTFNDVAAAFLPVSYTEHPAFTDTNRARTHIGVGEEVDLSFNPSPSFALTWTTTAGSVSGGYFVAPSNAASATVTATATAHPNAHVDFPTFSVKEPSGYDHAQIVSTNHYQIGEAGAGMINAVWIAPTSVSFYKVQMLEVGEPASNITGYFTNFSAGNLNHHLHGADTWFSLTENNEWWDEAAGGPFPNLPWTSGGFTWNVPAEWKVGNNGFTNTISGWVQMFSIDANGTATVQKFGNHVTRDTNDVININ